MKAKQFDNRFDEGQQGIVDSLDLSRARRVKQIQKRVNVDFPTWMIELLDKEANRMGITSQSIIKVWLAEKLERASSRRSLETDRSSPDH